MERKLLDKQLDEIVVRIVKDFKPDKVILFGSWAWGDPGPDSDVDLLIIKKTEDTRKLARDIDDALFPRPFPIDLIVYRPDQVRKREKMGDFFIVGILSKGKVLYAA